MQVKKEELKQEIMLAAEEEFIKKGYENSSLRVIAKKANTTLGNIYHYFDSKEDLLNAVCAPAMDLLHQIVTTHLDTHAKLHSLQEIEEAFAFIDTQWDQTDLKYLMDRRMIIVLDLTSTPLYEEKVWFLDKFKQHIKWHLNIEDDDDHYADIITNMFIDCIRHVLLGQNDPLTAKEEFFKIFRMLCTGIIVKED